MKLLKKVSHYAYKGYAIKLVHDPYTGFEAHITRIRDEELMLYFKYDEEKRPDYFTNMIDSYGMELR